MENFKFDRIVRTDKSEVYYIYSNDVHVGELHIHSLVNSPSHFTLILDVSLSEANENTILEQIDLDLSNDFDTPYHGYFINLYKGRFKEELEVINDE